MAIRLAKSHRAPLSEGGPDAPAAEAAGAHGEPRPAEQLRAALSDPSFRKAVSSATAGARGRFPAKRQIVDGERFASKLEANRYGELRLMERAGEIEGLRLHPAFHVEIGGESFCTYTADFSYWEKWRNGPSRRIIEEVKSTGTARDEAYRLRRKAAELYHCFEVTEVIK